MLNEITQFVGRVPACAAPTCSMRATANESVDHVDANVPGARRNVPRSSARDPRTCVEVAAPQASMVSVSYQKLARCAPVFAYEPDRPMHDQARLR